MLGPDGIGKQRSVLPSPSPPRGDGVGVGGEQQQARELRTMTPMDFA